MRNNNGACLALHRCEKKRGTDAGRRRRNVALQACSRRSDPDSKVDSVPEAAILRMRRSEAGHAQVKPTWGPKTGNWAAAEANVDDGAGQFSNFDGPRWSTVAPTHTKNSNLAKVRAQRIRTNRTTENQRTNRGIQFSHPDSTNYKRWRSLEGFEIGLIGWFLSTYESTT